MVLWFFVKYKALPLSDMEAILHRTLPLLVLSVLTPLAAVPTPGSAPTQVQEPFNLMKKSYNFNTTLYWEYNISSVTPYFQVEYRNNEWTVVETCVNISRNYCDLSEKITDPYIHYKVRIKAFVGSEVSGYAKTEVYLINDGIIGPPTLEVSEDGKFIYIDVDYPNAPHVDGKENVADYLADLTYELHYGDETEETDECDKYGCNFKVLITNLTNYCFWAQGTSESVPMTFEKSKETCINLTVQKGISSNKLYTIIVPISIVAFLILVVSCFLIKRKIQAKPMLPLSLNSVAKAMTTRDYLTAEQLTNYDQVSISPVDSPEKMAPEETNRDLNVSDDSDTRQSMDNGYHSSVGESEQKSDEDQNEKEEASSSKNYYTENSDSLLVCVAEEDVTEQEPLRDTKPVTNSYGYDKPHCPL